MRKGLRKQKIPKIFDGMWGSEPGIGGVKFIATSNNNYKVEWVSFTNGNKSEVKAASWLSLCTESSFELQRLEIGLIFSEILDLQAKKIMDSIGHPMLAIKESEPYRKDAQRWKHWALVKPKHMLGLP